MGRRRANKGFLDDGESSEGSGSDDEFDGDPYPKRRKTGGSGKEDALYGVFMEDDDGEGAEGFGRRRGGAETNYSSKAPAFAPSSSASKTHTNKDSAEADISGIPDFVPMASSRASTNITAALATNDDEAGTSGDDDDASSGDDFDSDDFASKPPSPRVLEADSDDEDNAPAARGGLGSGGGFGLGARVPPSFSAAPPSKFETEARHTGTGGGGIGFSRVSLPTGTGVMASALPAAFGGAPKPSTAPRSRYLRPPTPPPAAPMPGAIKLSKEDEAAFQRMEGSFGARMLAKQGWATGTGLGAAGKGIVTPVESKLRPRNMGIGNQGFKERTEQSRREAIRRGDEIAPEPEKPKGRAGTNKKGSRAADAGDSDAAGGSRTKEQPWRNRTKKTKIRVEHKTYDQIVAEAGEPGHAGGVGMIIDATGATPKEVSSLSALTLSTFGTSDTMRLPELRHNLRMICDYVKNDLDALAREGASVKEKRSWLTREDQNLRHKVSEEAKKIARLQRVHLLVDEVSSIAKTLSTSYEPSLEAFMKPFDQLMFEFAEEYKTYALDEVVVGALSPVFRRLVASWDPLSSSTDLFSSLRQWKKAFRFSDPNSADNESIEVYGNGNASQARKSLAADLVMTPYESMMWNVWLPRVRSAVNNEWSAEQPTAAVHLLDTWKTLLPRFIHDNILDQLILPKVNKAIADWKPRKTGPSLQSIVFPWLPFLGERMEDVLGDAKRRVRGLLKGWKVEERIPEELTKWKDVFTANEWDSLILKYILPKLGATLRDDFKINPRNQILTPLEHVLPWRTVLRPAMFSQLLETEFFPKWLDILYIWLIQPKHSQDEITQWYTYWKSVFPESVLALVGVSKGFSRGLDLMNEAMALGSSAATRLPKPSSLPPLSTPPTSRSSTPAAGASRKSAVTGGAAASLTSSGRLRPEEITFRSIAEEYVAARDLIWVPTGRSDVATGQMLFRVSRDGISGGVLCYVLDDAVYVSEPLAGPGGESLFKAVTLEGLVARAKGGVGAGK